MENRVREEFQRSFMDVIRFATKKWNRENNLYKEWATKKKPSCEEKEIKTKKETCECDRAAAG